MQPRSKPIEAWFTQQLPYPADAWAAVDALRRAWPVADVAWLDSLSVPGRVPRHSLIALAPLAVLEQPANGEGATLRLKATRAVVDHDANGWQLWRRCALRLGCTPRGPMPMGPGWIGYAGYEAAGLLERLPRPFRGGLRLPRMRLGLFDQVIVLDHSARRATLVRAPWLGGAFGLRGGAAEELAEVWCAGARRADAGFPRAPASPRVSCDVDPGHYRELVERVLEYIAAGDVYQVNLARCIRIEGLGPAWAAYARLRCVNPAPYAAFLEWGHDDQAGFEDAGQTFAIASVSPELFLKVAGDTVATRPIKGTRRRTGDAAVDAHEAEDLLHAEKDAAELAMIVDLHRNDLGRVCRAGTVRVAAARQLEAHPRVLHTVAEVRGRLAQGRDALDALLACFPAGSVTGAPKIRAMEIIHELERYPRGVFTGAIGALGLDGQMTMSVAIRTLQIAGESAELHVGGGVVAESDPQAEYEETEAKAQGILEALRAPSSSVSESRVAQPR